MNFSGQNPNQNCLDTKTHLQTEVTACQTAYQKTISKLVTDRNHAWLKEESFKKQACK